MNDKPDVVQAIADAKKNRLWGTIEIGFQDGEIYLIRETKTTKFKTRKGYDRDDFDQLRK